MIPIFIGYDYKEPIAFHVCANSIIRNSKKPVSIIPLALNLLDTYTEFHTDGSNSFTYTRFLVPYLSKFTGFAIFIDGDMIVKSDISELFNYKDSKFAVQVVKHNYSTSRSIKYLQNKNEDYPRKNWSSVILWNCEHVSNRLLTPSFIEDSSGSQLHRFAWLADNEIGELPIEWNWLVDEFGANYNANLLHFTLGIPNFQEFSDVSHSSEWFDEQNKLNFYKK